MEILIALITIVIFWTVPIMVGKNFGEDKGYDTACWLLPLFFGWLGAIIVMVMPYKED